MGSAVFFFFFFLVLGCCFFFLFLSPKSLIALITAHSFTERARSVPRTTPTPSTQCCHSRPLRTVRSYFTLAGASESAHVPNFPCVFVCACRCFAPFKHKRVSFLLQTHISQLFLPRSERKTKHPLVVNIL